MKIILALAALIITGCASTIDRKMVDTADPETYTYPDGKRIIVSGHVDRHITGKVSNLTGSWQTLSKAYLTVLINGKPALRGPLDGNHMTGSITGEFEEKPVASICTSSQKTPEWIDVKCIIMLDEQQVALLRF